MPRSDTLAAAAVLLILAAGASAQAPPRVERLRIQILSTMLSDRGFGEWGFSALVEADGRRLLFDTGHYPDTVLRNVRELGVDLSGVEEVILSHNHLDHTGGLLTLRREFMKKNPKALSRVHVAEGIFWPRPGRDGADGNPMPGIRQEFEATGGAFVIHSKPAPIARGLWLTGPVPRVHPEKNFPASQRVKTPQGEADDNIPEDMSLVFDTGPGLVLLSGCGHAGIVNTLDFARKELRQAPVHAALGGFHLFQLPDAGLEWTARKLADMKMAHFMGAHCTGIEATYRLRAGAGLTRKTCVVGAVGAEFVLGEGLKPGNIAR